MGRRGVLPAGESIACSATSAWPRRPTARPAGGAGSPSRVWPCCAWRSRELSLVLDHNEPKEAKHAQRIEKTASAQIALKRLDVRLENLEGGYSVCFESHTADADLADLFRGLPDDRAQLPRWGYVIKGKVGFRFSDREETTRPATPLRPAGPHTGPLHGNGDRRVQPYGDPWRDDPRGDEEPSGGRSRRGEPLVSYRLAYAIGFHPREDLAAHPPSPSKLLELVALEVADTEPDPVARPLQVRRALLPAAAGVTWARC